MLLPLAGVEASDPTIWVEIFGIGKLIIRK
jgi:hypothetical protein